MNSGHEIVVSNLSISAKEQQLKQRFLSNSKKDPEKEISAAPPQADPGFQSFLAEMQSTLKQQGSGTAATELMKQQAVIMQQQVDLIREEQKSFRQVVKHLSKPVSEDPKRMLAELLAPLNKQILEVKSYYEETKNTAKEISSQVTELKKTVGGKAPQVKRSIEEGLSKFASKKAAFDSKVREAESVVSEVMVDAEEKMQLGTCKHGIEYLREQIEAVQRDTEKIELDLQTRFKRIVQQAQQVKTIPSELQPQSDFKSSEDRILNMIGRIDYDEILSEIDHISSYKSKIVQDYKKGAPTYPKFTRPITIQVTEKKTVKKPTQMHPIPSNAVKKTYTNKPSNLHNIPSQPRVLGSNRSKPSYRSSSENQEVPLKTQKKTQEEESILKVKREVKGKIVVEKERLSSARSEIERNEGRESRNESFRDEREEREENEGKKREKVGFIRAEEPEPFQTRPGVTRGEQTKQISFTDVYPGVKNFETQEPPKPSLERQTVDIVTEYVLNNLIKGKTQVVEKVQEVQPSRWLGVEELSELTRLGIYVDPMTIEKIGREVLQSEINELKQKPKPPTKLPVKPNLSIPNYSEPPELKVSDPEDQYGSDFEEMSSDKKEELSDRKQNSNESNRETKAALFDKISPKTPPMLYEKRFTDPPERSPISQIQEHPTSNLSSLLDPRLLGRMSASSIQHYISSLIDAGHLPRSQDTPSFLSRSPTPATQPLITPQNKPTSDTTILEPKVPEEIKDFFTGPVGSQILNTFKQQAPVTPQQLMESWAKGFLGKYPPGQELQTGKSEAEAFAKPMSRGAKVFDVDLEEKLIFEENSTIRKVIKVPVLEIQHKTEKIEVGNLVTDSEVSGLSHAGSVGSEVFNIDNPEFFGGFVDFVRKARELEEGQLPGNSDLSEGEVRVDDEGLSSGEIPKDVLRPEHGRIQFEKEDKFRISGSGILSDEDFQVSEEPEEGEFDPQGIFKV